MAHGGGGGGAGGGKGLEGIAPRTGKGTAFVGLALAFGVVWLMVKRPKEFLVVLAIAFPIACLSMGTPPQNSIWLWLPLLLIGLWLGTGGNDKYNEEANARGRAAVQARNEAQVAEDQRLDDIRNGRKAR